MQKIKNLLKLTYKQRIILGSCSFIICVALIIFFRIISPVLGPEAWIVTFSYFLLIPFIFDKKEASVSGFLLGLVTIITIPLNRPTIAQILSAPMNYDFLLYVIAMITFIITTSLIGFFLGNFRELMIAEEMLIKTLETERTQVLSIFNSIKELIMITHIQTNEVLFVNKALMDLLGPDSIGRKCYEILEGKEIPCKVCPLKKLLKNRTAKVTWEYYNQLLDRYFIRFDRLIIWPDGREVLFTSAVDITERKRIEKEKLELAERREMFISTTSHELRTPLTIIKGYHDLLEQRWNELSEDKINLMLYYIGKSVTRLERLVDNVSDITILNLGLFHIVPEKFDIHEFLMEILVSFQMISDLIIEIDFNTDTPIYVNADPEGLEHVITNIVDNALKQTPKDNKRIIVSTKLSESELIIRITDNGIGIEKEVIDKIFEQFTSISTEYSTRRTGIGLYISREIINAHGGKIYAESKGKGYGSTFTVKIPLY